MPTGSKEWKKVIKEAHRQGWRCVLLKSGHWRLYAPDGENIVHAGGTPSDRRSLDNTISEMRRYGFRWKRRRT
jgi:hypothetical protein